MSKKLLVAFAAVVPAAVIIALILCSTPARSADAQAQGFEVRVDNFTFNPPTLTVPVNTSVNWLNKDDIPHVIASSEDLFQSKALDTDDKYSFTFTKPGTYSYFCAIHPKMVGKIVVR